MPTGLPPSFGHAPGGLRRPLRDRRRPPSAILELPMDKRRHEIFDRRRLPWHHTIPATRLSRPLRRKGQGPRQPLRSDLRSPYFLHTRTHGTTSGLSMRVAFRMSAHRPASTAPASVARPGYRRVASGSTVGHDGTPAHDGGLATSTRCRPSWPTAGALALWGRRHRCRSRVSLFGHSERLYGLPMHIHSERRVQWPFHGSSQRAVKRPFNTATHHTRYRATAFGLSVRSPCTTLRAVTPCAFEGHTARQPSAQTFGLSISTLVTTALQSAVRIAAFCSNPTPEASASRSRSRRIVRFRRRRHRMEVPTSPPRHGFKRAGS